MKQQLLLCLGAIMRPITGKGDIMKEQRFYTKQDDIYLIHDQPTHDKSSFVSIVDDLTFYRRNFNLEKAWG